MVNSKNWGRAIKAGIETKVLNPDKKIIDIKDLKKKKKKQSKLKMEVKK